MRGPVSRDRIIERERRWGRWAAVGATVPVFLFIASLFVRAGVELPGDTLYPSFFRAVDANSGAWIAGAVLQGLALMLMAVPLTYLFVAAAVRSEKVLRPLVGFCVIGPVLVGLQTALQGVAQVDAAQTFVSQAAGVGDVYTLAADVYEDVSLRQVASAIGAGGALSLVFAMVYTPLWATRTGLVTRFYGTLGMALGASLLFPPLAELALPALFVWFAYMGMLFANRLRRGRPPAWDEGVAVPPPPRGAQPEPATGPRDDVIEGDASEIPGVDENPNAARRERAKRRKRKRRH